MLWRGGFRASLEVKTSLLDITIGNQIGVLLFCVGVQIGILLFCLAWL